MADEDRLTVRERRAQHAKSQARKGAPGKVLRKAIVPAIILLVIAAIATGMYFNDKNAAKCPGHWHATFDVYVQDGNQTRRMSFAAPQFDLNGQTPFRSHMHQADRKNQFHFEQGGLCVGVEEAFGYIDVDINANSLVFDGVHGSLGQDGTYRGNETHPLTAWIQHISDRGERDASGRVTSATLEWREHSLRSIQDYQLKDGERLLILHGSYTADEIAAMQAAVAPVDGYTADVYA